jgi:hypothetical protein
VWCDDESGSIVSATAFFNKTAYITNGFEAVAVVGGHIFIVDPQDTPGGRHPLNGLGSLFAGGGWPHQSITDGTRVGAVDSKSDPDCRRHRHRPEDAPQALQG